MIDVSLHLDTSMNIQTALQFAALALALLRARR